MKEELAHLEAIQFSSIWYLVLNRSKVLSSWLFSDGQRLNEQIECNFYRKVSCQQSFIPASLNRGHPSCGDRYMCNKNGVRL